MNCSELQLYNNVYVCIQKLQGYGGYVIIQHFIGSPWRFKDPGLRG